MTRPPPDAHAPLHSPAWWSYALACAERAIEEGQSVEWNQRVVKRIRERQGWPDQEVVTEVATSVATVVATEVALQLSPATTAFIERLRSM